MRNAQKDSLNNLGYSTFSRSRVGDGRLVRIVGDSYESGDLVRCATDDTLPELDAGKDAGPDSWQQVYQTLDAADEAAQAAVSVYGIVHEEGIDGSLGHIGDEGFHDAFVSYDAALPLQSFLMPDFASKGLVPWDGSKPAVARVAVAVAAPAAAVRERVRVLFDGMYRFA